MIKALTILPLFVLSLFGQEWYYSYGKKVHITETQTDSRSSSNRQFKTANGRTLLVADEIIVSLTVDASIDELLKEYPISLVEKIDKHNYLVRVTEKDSLFSTANSLYEDKRTTLCAPNFSRESRGR